MTEHDTDLTESTNGNSDAKMKPHTGKENGTHDSSSDSRSRTPSSSSSSSNCCSRSNSPMDHEQHKGESGNLLHDAKFLALIAERAQARNNNFNTFTSNECMLDSKNRIVGFGNNDLLHDPEFLMDIALLAAERSHDPKTKVGACIIDWKNRIIGIGYNRFPVNYSEEPYPWGKSKCDPLQDKRTFVVHAEADAIIGRIPADLRGATIYSTLLPCNECAKLIIQSGIRKVYYKNTKQFEKWIYQASRRLLEGARVELRKLP